MSTDFTTTEFNRPLPNWVRWLGIATICAMVPLVALGGQTTTRVAGMADPVWPTEPWYLVVNSHTIFKEPQPGWVLEHTHRVAGWVTGFLALGFALATWRYEPNRSIRNLSYVSLVFLIVAYGAFHGAMMQIKTDPQAFGAAQSITGALSILAAVAVAWFAVAAIRGGQLGSWTRGLSAIGLVCVMIQGLLGGFRVLLNAWFGPDLATVHGCFAHVVVCTYVAAVILAAPSVAAKALSFVDRHRIGKWIIAGIGLVFLQLIWGAFTRHWGSALAQRLHLLTAFAATAVVVTIAVLILSRESIKQRYGGYAMHLLGIVFLQVALGVEAYIGKFAAVGPFANLPPSQRPITDGQALTRTGHVLVGLTLLASLVAMAVRVYRNRPTSESVQQSEPGDVLRAGERSALEPVVV